MSDVMDILNLVIRRIEQDNPHSLILKGGTALSYYHLNGHRDSEDLDFDAPDSERENIEQIKSWFEGIFIIIRNTGRLRDFEITKATFSNADRYYMKIKLTTHKDNLTKVDIDFRAINGHVEYKGELGFYSSERMLLTKLLTYRSRRTLKDIYDIHHLLKVIDQSRYKNRSELQALVSEVIDILDNDELERNYRTAFRNTDMKFKYLKERDIGTFRNKTLKDLKILRNQLSR